MDRGHTFLEVARHVTLYGDSSASNKFLEARFDRPSWRKLYFVSQRFKDRDLYTQSRYHDTLNYKYPSVEAFTKVLEVVLIGEKAFKFDEVGPSKRRVYKSGFDWGDYDIWDREGKCGLYHI